MAKETQDPIPNTLQHGVVVKFDAERGFGFIRPDGAPEGGGKDVFVHIRNVPGHKSLYPGQRVRYTLIRTEKGLAAINVQAGSVLGTSYLRYVLTGLGTAVVLLLFLSTVIQRPTSSLALWIAMWAGALSISTLGLYGYDKAQAQGGGPRVPELVLHLLAALGGTPGAYLGMRLFRHKTNKSRFQAIFWLIVAAQLGVVAWWFLNL